MGTSTIDDDRTERPAADVVDAVEQLGALVSATHAALLEQVRVVVADELWREDGAHSPAHWLSWRLGVTHEHAAAMVKVAETLGRCPRLAAAFGEGRLSLDKLRALSRVAGPDNDEFLAEEAPKWTARQCAQYARKVAPPDDRDAKAAHDDQQVKWRWNRPGTVLRFWGRLVGDGAETFVKAVTRGVDTHPKHPDGSVVPWGVRAANTVVTMAQAYLDGRDATGDAGATIVLHADVETVLGVGRGPVDGESGAALVPEALRRLLCDAKVQVTADCEHGHTLGVGHTVQSPPRWLRRLIIQRDTSCRFPGCELRIHQIHHIVHWAKRGPTDAPNLVGICYFHHHLLHEGGWNIEGDANGALVFVGPDGRRILETPPPLRDDVRARMARIFTALRAQKPVTVPFDLDLALEVNWATMRVDLDTS